MIEITRLLGSKLITNATNYRSNIVKVCYTSLTEADLYSILVTHVTMGNQGIPNHNA